MAKRHPNPRLVKIHRSYTVEDVANLFGMHKNTVRNWIKDGLATIDDKRPMLVLGSDLEAFIKKRRTKNKQPCKLGELYCFKCRGPRFPAEDMAEYSPVTEKFGNLTAICPDCDCIMNKRISLAKIREISSKMDITFPEGLQHIVKMARPSVNSDLKLGE